MKKIESFAREQSRDRPFITEMFSVLAPEFLERQVEKGRTREKALRKIRESNMHSVMEGIWLFPIANSKLGGGAKMRFDVSLFNRKQIITVKL